MIISEVKVYPEYFLNYFKLIGDQPIEFLAEERIRSAAEFYQSIPASKWSYAYATGKWALAKVVQHIIDAELIFLYRAVSIARGEKQKLPGWSEDEYALQVDEQNLTAENLLNTMELQMKLSHEYIKSFRTSDMEKTGISNNNDVSVAALCFAFIAHEVHHRNVIKERYLSQ